MECDYTHLNNNLLVSAKKKGHGRCDNNEGLMHFYLSLMFRV
jgi:hypothetical protein